MSLEEPKEEIPGCCPFPTRWTGDALAIPLPGLNDEEAARLPSMLPPVFDTHVHLFPDRVFEALWRWFDKNAWPVRYKIFAPKVVDFVLSRGVKKMVALHYAHKPGMAQALNQFMKEVCSRHAQIVGTATVFPGEDNAVQILADGFSSGLRGVKLHCHVQRFSPDGEKMNSIYRLCEEQRQPMLIHAGRQPASAAYGFDIEKMCGAEHVEEVLRSFPRLKLCIPHLGADEFEAYATLLQKYDNLWLDTTMMAANYFPVEGAEHLVRLRSDRIMYGTDFPSIPYAWDREIKGILSMKLREPQLAAVLGENAECFWGTNP